MFFELVLISGVGILVYALTQRHGSTPTSTAAGTYNPTSTQQSVSNNSIRTTVPLNTSPATTLEQNLGSSLVTRIGTSVAGSAGLAGGGIAAGAVGAGIGALAVLAAIGIGNLARCGTLTSIGCTKRSDANATEEAIGMARLIYQAFLDQRIDKTTALAGFAQIASEFKQYMLRPTDYTEAAPNPNYACGDFRGYSPAAFSALGSPADLPYQSPAFQAFCAMRGFSLQFMLETGFPNLVNGSAPSSYFNGGSAASAAAANQGLVEQ